MKSVTELILLICMAGMMAGCTTVEPEYNGITKCQIDNTQISLTPEGMYHVKLTVKMTKEDETIAKYPLQPQIRMHKGREYINLNGKGFKFGRVKMKRGSIVPPKPRRYTRRGGYLTTIVETNGVVTATVVLNMEILDNDTGKTKDFFDSDSVTLNLGRHKHSKPSETTSSREASEEGLRLDRGAWKAEDAGADEATLADPTTLKLPPTQQGDGGTRRRTGE